MKDILKYLFLLLLMWSILYGAFAFIEMSFNPSAWSYWSRSIMTLCGLSCFYWSGYLIVKL